MNSKPHAPNVNGEGREAFTFIELLVVIAVLALLAVMLLPALANSQPDSRTFRCLNNQRQLMVAWRMYAEDNNDYLAGNDFPWMSLVSSITPALARANWAPGSMTLFGDNTNVANLKNPVISQLFNYLKTADVFKCPADKSLVVRSVSMNSAVGTRWTYPDNSYFPPTGVLRGSQPLSGAVLPGTYNPSQTTWQTYAKFSSIVRPTPAGLYVIMDEHPDSINDSTIATPAVPGILVDYPASYHDGGAGGLAFADGHTEMHRWVDTRTKPPITGVANSLAAGSSPNNADTVWLSQRTSALR